MSQLHVSKILAALGEVQSVAEILNEQQRANNTNIAQCFIMAQEHSRLRLITVGSPPSLRSWAVRTVWDNLPTGTVAEK